MYVMKTEYENMFILVQVLVQGDQKVSDLGWVERGMRCSIILLGQLVAMVAAHQPRELQNLSQHNTVRDLLGHPELVLVIVHVPSATSKVRTTRTEPGSDEGFYT